MDNETKYSYILPIRNRANLLKRGLESLLAMEYDKEKFEVVIVDYMSEDKIKDVIGEFRGLLNMKYACIDIRRYKYHKIFLNGGNCNPALAQNIGAKIASGKFLTLTSPEIVHSKYNLENLDKIENLESKFIYGRVIEKTEKDIFSLHFPFDVVHKLDSPNILCDWTTTLESYALYFIGVISRATFIKYGGIDEKYMCNIAYDDEDFGYRMKAVGDEILKLEFHKEISGVHLTHDRSYQNFDAIKKNADYYKSKKDDGLHKHLVANIGYEMGDTNTLIEKSEYWRY